MKDVKETGAVNPDIPLDVSFTLTSDDVYSALKNTKKYKKNLIKAVVETGVLAGLTIFFGLWWIMWDDFNAMIFCMCFAVLIAIVWAVVSFSIRKQCHRFVTGQEVQASVFKDKLVINDENEIPLDGTVRCRVMRNVLVLETGQNEWTIIPMKNISNAEEVKNRILAGTRAWNK